MAARYIENSEKKPTKNTKGSPGTPFTIAHLAASNIILINSFSLKEIKKTLPILEEKADDKNFIFVMDVDDLSKQEQIRTSSSLEAICVDVLQVIAKYPDSTNPDVSESKATHAADKDSLFQWVINHRAEGFGAYLIIRIGYGACLWIDLTRRDEDKKIAKLFWHSLRPMFERKETQGWIVGMSTLLGTFLTKRLAKSDRRSLDKKVAEAIEDFLRSAAILFSVGYEKEANDSGNLYPPFVTKVLLHGKRKLSKKSQKDEEIYKIESVTLDWAEVVEHEKQWRIAERSLIQDLAREGNPAAIENIPPGEIFKRAGVGVLTERGGWNIPEIQINDLRLVDRLEIEDYLAVRNVLLEYTAGNGEKQRPLSIAVFGPPGDGKSYGVKQVIADVAKGQGSFEKEPHEYNMSQFTNLSELWGALHKSRNTSLKQRIPIIFIDEFDATFEQQQFGWLKYFLAPMQDGVFTENGREFNLGRMVFVFAGGVNRSMDEFSSRVRNASFCAAKGPDFISRLKGVLNIRGISKTDDSLDCGMFVLRRAIKLADIIQRLHDEHGIKKSSITKPLMEESLARAFLGVGCFKHGVRSMEAILRMSRFNPGETLRRSDLPVKEQTSLHVDWREFFYHMNSDR